MQDTGSNIILHIDLFTNTVIKLVSTMQITHAHVSCTSIPSVLFCYSVSYMSRPVCSFVPVGLPARLFRLAVWPSRKTWLS